MLLIRVLGLTPLNKARRGGAASIHIKCRCLRALFLNTL